MKAYTVFSYYGKKEVINDIIDYINNNPNKLDFDEYIDIRFGRLMSDEAYICVGIEVFDYAILKEFVLTAELLHEVN